MQTEGKTLVIITQEVLAMLSTRKEAAERISAKLKDENGAENMRKKCAETEGFIIELMDELQQYGDAVMADTDRENNYQNTWRDTLKVLDTAGSNELQKRFAEMEIALASTYKTILESKTEWTDTLQKKLQRQVRNIVDGNQTP